jgi:hypothetical protein
MEGAANVEIKTESRLAAAIQCSEARAALIGRPVRH